MVPIVFGGCFGWFHPAKPGDAVRPAVLLCSGISQDFSNGYRPFRLLADRLASEGYPVLRFDYPGMGDSADSGIKSPWDAWQGSVDLAAFWLCEQTGSAELILIGLRLGGALAAMAAARHGNVAALILIEPCLSGRSYVSQLVTEARLRGAQQSEGGVELGELRLSAECLQQMRAVSLADLVLPQGLPVAIYTHMQADKTLSRLALWAERGVSLTCAELDGLAAMLRPSHHTGESELEPTRLLDWLRRVSPQKSQQDLELPAPEALILPGSVETVLRFGATWQLTGVLCRPTLNRFPGSAVLICNAGGNPRHGFARFGVEFARTLAAEGIASLRFDFAGLGDSVHYEGAADVQTDVFTVDRNDDVHEAVDALEALGFHNFALHGLCSGAYHAVRGVCSDARISLLLAINLPWFSLLHERPGPASVAQNSMRALARRNSAALFIFGEGDPGLKSFEKHFGAGGSELPPSQDIQFCAMPGFDHELTAMWMRHAAADKMIHFLQDNWSVTVKGERRYGHA